MICEPRAGHWTSKHTGSPWDAFGQPYTRMRHEAGVACSQHSVISTGLLLSVFTTSFATVSRSACLFFFFCKSTWTAQRRAGVSLSFKKWLQMRDLTSCFSGPLPVFVAPEATVMMTMMMMMIEEGRGHRGRFLVTKMSTRRMARSRSFSEVMARMVSWALFSRGSTASSHQHHAGPLGLPWKHRRK